MRLTRRYRFSASHRLDSPRFTPEENRRLYGKCNNPYGHGHNYTLDVSVRGTVDFSTGRLIDVAALDRLVRSSVLARLDHKNFNIDLPEFASAVPGIVPTTENIAAVIRDFLQQNWRSVFPNVTPILDRIRIEETNHNFFELHTL
ncbi:MAG: 6-carboxytetrahydropterin synthase [Bryobacteraceae bacterium]